MKFETGHPIAEIDEARSGIRDNGLLSIFQTGQKNDFRLLFDLLILARPQIEEEGSAIPFLVKGGIAFAEKLLHQRWNGIALLFHPLHRGLHSDGIPCFKGPQFPVISPSHRPIDAHDIINDFRNLLRRIEKGLLHRFPDKLSPPVRAHGKGLDPLSQIFNVFSRLYGGKAHSFLWPVINLLIIQNKNLFFPFSLHLFVETLSGLLSQPLVLHHLVDKRRQLKITPLFLRQTFDKIFRHMDHHIQSHNVSRAKSGALRFPRNRSGQQFYLFDPISVFQHRSDHCAHGKGSDAVGNEIGRILGKDHPFSQNSLPNLHHSFNDSFRCRC